MKNTSAEFLGVCKERLDAGEAKYGPVRADDRNRCKEAIEEVADIFNYVVPIMLAKHKEMKERLEWEHTVTHTFRLYRSLLLLQEIEVEMENKLKEVKCAEEPSLLVG